MTVAELIKKLQELDQSKLIYLEDEYGYRDVGEIRESEDGEDYRL